MIDELVTRYEISAIHGERWPHPEGEWVQYSDHAKAIERLTAHTKALVEGAGEVAAELNALANKYHLNGGCVQTELDRQAAATIAALKAEIERLTRALRSIAWPMNEAGPWAQAVAASALPDTKADSDGDDGA